MHYFTQAQGRCSIRVQMHRCKFLTQGMFLHARLNGPDGVDSCILPVCDAAFIAAALATQIRRDRPRDWALATKVDFRFVKTAVILGLVKKQGFKLYLPSILTVVQTSLKHLRLRFSNHAVLK